jgi:hypothetical protein
VVQVVAALRDSMSVASSAWIACASASSGAVPARDGAQAEERDADLAVAELPPGRGICLVVLVKGVAHLDPAGLEGGKKAFQVIDSVLNLNGLVPMA